MSGAYSVKHIPQVNGEHYEVESDVNQIFMRSGLPGANNYGSPDSNWFNQRLHDKCNLELLLHRYVDADKEGKDRARKTIQCIEGNLYFDTGKPYVV